MARNLKCTKDSTCSEVCIATGKIRLRGGKNLIPLHVQVSGKTFLRV